MSDFKITEPGEYLTRGGEVVTVKVLDLPGRYPVMGYRFDKDVGAAIRSTWKYDGSAMDACTSSWDIVDVYRPMVEREGWLVIWKDCGGSNVCSRNVFSKVEHAEAYISGGQGVIAHITWKEPAE